MEPQPQLQPHPDLEQESIYEDITVDIAEGSVPKVWQNIPKANNAVVCVVSSQIQLISVIKRTYI